jgi:hypothetical protein
MHFKIAALILPVLAVANPLPLSGTTPDPGQITILDSAYSGNGCPQGSVSTSTSPDKTIITYGFDQFQTYIGPGIVASEHSKNCQLHLSLKYPGGFQYSVVAATYHGFARLDKGVTGTFLTSYFFSQDASKTSTTRMTATGGGGLELGQVYTKQDTIETTATIWSPCGTTGLLNMNNRLSLTTTNTSASGELSNDDATVAFTQQLHVAWRACTGSGSSGSGDNNVGLGPSLGTPSSELGFGN